MEKQHIFGLALLLFASLFFNVTDLLSQNKTSSTKELLDTQIADSLRARGIRQYKKRDLAGAAVLFEDAEQHYVENENWEGAVLSTLYLSYIVESTASKDSLYAVLEKAQYYSVKIASDAPERGHIYQRMSEVNVREDNFDDARYFANKAIQIFDGRKDSRSAKNESYKLRLQIGAIEIGLFNYEEAKRYYNEAILLAKADNFEYDAAITQLFHLASVTKDYDTAEAIIKEVEQNNLLKGSALFLTYDYYSDLIHYYCDVGEFNKALEGSERLKNLIKGSAFGSHFTNWYFDQLVASVYFKKGDYNMTIEILEQSIVTKTQTSKRANLRANDYRQIAISQHRLGKIAAAKEAFQNAINYHIPVEEQTNDFLAISNYDNATYKSSLFSILYYKTKLALEIYEESDNIGYQELALHNFRSQHKILIEMGRRSSEDLFIESDVFAEMYEQYLNVLYSKWNENKDDVYFYEALQVADESKNSAILQEINDLKRARNFANIPKELLEREENIKFTLDTLTKSFQAEKYQSKHDSLILEMEVVKNELRVHNPNYYQLSYGQDIPLKEIIDKNFSNQNVIEYLVGENYIFVLSTHENATSFKKVRFTEELKNAINNYIKDVRNPISADYEQVAKRIFGALFEPFLNKNKSNVLILDGLLHLIPISALSSDANQYSLLRVNTITQYVESKNKQLDAALIMAPFAQKGSELHARLSGSLEEAKRIQDIVGGNIKIDAEATKNVFLSEANNYAILHIATHSEVNLESPLKSIIYFSSVLGEKPSESELKVEDLYAMRLQSDLVTLSACETGLGKEIKGKGVQSISNAFSFAGVGSTVMSLWKVPDAQTQTVMKNFYKHLAAGKLKNDALQLAKKDYLDAIDDPVLAHPYYWAGFVVSGDPSPIETSNTINWYVAIGFLLLGLIGFGYIIRRRTSSNVVSNSRM